MQDEPDFLNDSPKNNKEDKDTKPTSNKKQSQSNTKQRDNNPNSNQQQQQQQPKACAFVIDIKNPPKNQPTEDKANKLTEGQDNDEGGERLECPYCKRKFNQESYEKHVSVCDKVFHDKRNKFDTQKQRLSEIEQIGFVKKQDLNKKKPNANGVGTGSIKANGKDPKGNKWNKKSEELRAIIKMNKSHEKGFGLTQPSTASSNSNSIQPMKEEPDFFTPASKNSQSNALRSDTFVECNLCKKKYTDLKYKDHLADCEAKYREIENKQKMKKQPMQLMSIGGGYSITPRTNGFTSDTVPQMQLGGNKGGIGGVAQREQIVFPGGMNSKPNCNWGSKPVLNLKFGKK